MKKYFPILVSKQGEFNALSHLTMDVKQSITPIIQILKDKPKEEKTNAKRKSTEKPPVIITTLTNEWNFTGNEIYIDFSLYDPFDYQKGKWLMDNLVVNNVNVVPVVNVENNREYIEMLRGMLTRRSCSSVCIRLPFSSNLLSRINQTISSISSELNLNKGEISLLFDLGNFDPSIYSMYADALRNTLTAIENIDEYKEIIVASSSFPSDIGALPKGLSKIKRHEWILWNYLIDLDLPCPIKYGDFGTKNSVYKDVGFLGSCSIKYSLEKDYLINKGMLAKNHQLGNGQYVELARELVNSPDYLGPDFSWGDARINHYANLDEKSVKLEPGNATVWVGICQNHHITLINSLL